MCRSTVSREIVSYNARRCWLVFFPSRGLILWFLNLFVKLYPTERRLHRCYSHSRARDRQLFYWLIFRFEHNFSTNTRKVSTSIHEGVQSSCFLKKKIPPMITQRDFAWYFLGPRKRPSLHWELYYSFRSILPPFRFVWLICLIS